MEPPVPEVNDGAVPGLGVDGETIDEDENFHGNGTDAEAPSTSQAASGSTQFDLEAYIGNYTGHSKIARLRFISERAPAPLDQEAIRMCLEELRKGENTSMYEEVSLQAVQKFGSQFAPDMAWIESVDRKAAARLDKLESELNTYKTNMIKESIRMGHNDLGDFFYQRGEFHNALKSYTRTRDYCSTSKHIVAMCLNVIRVSIELGNFVHVANYAQKAEQTPEVQDQLDLAKLRCASGLAHLEHKKYKLAARRFVETQFEQGTFYTDVMAPQDVAVYGGLCALASFDRTELRTKVIDSPSFRNFLELVPEVRELINDFYMSRYASCLVNLRKLQAELALDIHLHDHVDALYEMIRHKALIQYTTPFTSVSLATMAEGFVTTVTELEKELAALIMNNQIQARIDSHNKILYARHADQRNTTFQRALAVGQTYQRDTSALLLRANLIRNDLIQQRQTPVGGGGGGGQGGSNGHGGEGIFLGRR